MMDAAYAMNSLSTYRLQLHTGFTFEDAFNIADCLKIIGVSHVYCDIGVTPAQIE
jgi:maltooligosyltrehalose synthase